MTADEVALKLLDIYQVGILDGINLALTLDHIPCSIRCCNPHRLRRLPPLRYGMSPRPPVFIVMRTSIQIRLRHQIDSQ